MVRIPPELDGWSVKALAEFCEVDSSTARRWKRGAMCPPRTALMLLAGDLGCFDARWRGWRIQGESLLPPQGWPIRRNDALAVPLLHGQIAALRQEIERLKAELAAREAQPEQPRPEEWVIRLGKL